MKYNSGSDSPYTPLIRQFAMLDAFSTNKRYEEAMHGKLGVLLAKDEKDVLARLCLDALVHERARLSDPVDVPLLTALAVTVRNPGNEALSVQGRTRLQQRLRILLDLQPDLAGKQDALVYVRLVMMRGSETFIIVHDKEEAELYGVVRISDMRRYLLLSSALQ